MRARLQSIRASAHRGRVLRASLLLGAALAACIGVAGFGWLRSARSALAFDSEQAALEAASAGSEALRALASDLAAREARVRELRARGFMSAADRVGWAEAVTTAVETLRPARFKLEVGAESPQPLLPTVQAWYDERGLAAPRLVANVLQLEVDGLHEDELVALLQLAQRAGGAVVRIERCRIERREDTGALGAACTLRRFAMLPPAATEATT